MRPSRLAPAALLFGLVAWGAASGGAPRVHRIAISQLAFGQDPPDVHVNDRVEWDNKDLFQHSATAADGSFDVELPAGSEGRATLNRAGVVPYICRYHPGMTGRLTVKP